MNYKVLVYILTGCSVAGLVSCDAWQRREEINLEISVPKGLGASDSSITDAVAEDLFLNEIAEIDSVSTFVTKPRVRSTNEQTVVSIIGDKLGLHNVSLMIQQVMGLDPLVIKGAIIKRGNNIQLVLVSNPDGGAGQHLSQIIETKPGENVVKMIRRAAPEAMLAYQDYVVCLYLVGKASSNDLKNYEAIFDRPGIEGLDLLIQKRMEIQPSGLEAIKNKVALTRRKAMFINLRGILALTQGDDKKAAQYFDESRNVLKSFSVATLNLAFVAIHQDRYEDAIALAKKIIETESHTKNPALLGPTYTTWGVAAWGLKRYDEAAEQFKAANMANPRATLANLYWSEMLESLGDKDGSAEKFSKFIENSKYFSPYAETAIFSYRLSPNDHTPLTKL